MARNSTQPAPLATATRAREIRLSMLPQSPARMRHISRASCRIFEVAVVGRTSPTRSERRCESLRKRSATTRPSPRSPSTSQAFRKAVSATPARGDLHNGNNLYQGKCGACHGSAAEGNAALKSPRLTGLDAAYIKRQFAHFRDGVRGADPQDVTGRQMAMMAKTLTTERDLDDVIAFIQQKGRGK